MGNVRIKSAKFDYIVDNRFNLYIDKVTGYGIIYPVLSNFNNLQNIQVNENNLIYFSQILNPTGVQPALIYKTGILSGIIPPGNNGSFTWTNINLTDIGTPNNVYLNYATGYIQAKNTLEFNSNLLRTGDNININGVFFSYFPNKNPSNILSFSNFNNLINILNSGATGAFNNLGFSVLQNIVGVTGFIDSNRLNLFSFLKSGEDGNNIRIYRVCEDLNAIVIKSRYFTGGRHLRPTTDTWYGNFSNTFNTLTQENSGIYRININEPINGSVSGVTWVDNFSGNYRILTGIYNINSQNIYSGFRVPFINNKYYGTGIIPSGQLFIPTGLKIEITKPNPYNISGNLAKYIFSGDGFIFSGIIEG